MRMRQQLVVSRCQVSKIVWKENPRLTLACVARAWSESRVSGYLASLGVIRSMLYVVLDTIYNI